MTVARLEKQEHWRLDETGRPVWTRILCGKRNRQGAQRCSGCLAWLHFSIEGWPDYLLMRGMRRGRDGVYRPIPDALVVYKETGELIEPVSVMRQERAAHHHYKNVKQGRGPWHIPLFPPPATVPRAKCPRCGELQDLLDAEDLDILQNAMR
jgi:hypothetical protein